MTEIFSPFHSLNMTRRLFGTHSKKRPMKKLDRYVAYHLLKGYGLVLAILLSLFSFLAFLEELEEVGQGQYHLLNAFHFVALTLPTRIVNLMPITALLGSMMALGQLTTSLELIAMQSVGVSVRRITWTVLRTAALLMLATMVLQQFIAPQFDQSAQTQRSLEISGTGSLQTDRGFWFKGHDHYTSVGRMRFGEIPENIEIYQFDEQGQLRTYIHAEEADIRDPKQWVLQNIKQKLINDQGITTHTLPSLPWEPFLSAEQISYLLLSPDTLSLSDLYQYTRYLRATGQIANHYELALWQKVSMPFATGAMVFIAIPFIIGPLRETTAGKRILIGTIVGIAYYLGSQIFKQVGLQFELHPALTTMAPIGIVGGVALWLFRRIL